MRTRRSLRHRILAWLAGYAALLLVAMFTHSLLVNEEAEQLVWESLLDSELAHFLVGFDRPHALQKLHLLFGLQCTALPLICGGFAGFGHSKSSFCCGPARINSAARRLRSPAHVSRVKNQSRCTVSRA